MVVQGLLPQLQRPSKEEKRDDKDEMPKVSLEEKHCRRMEKYSGEVSGYRMWTFDFVVALGQVDSRLSDEIRKLIGRDDLNGLPTEWDPSKDVQLNQEIYQKYK
eukprot:12428299-Karenia_brevis.AAC.1